MSKIDSLGDRQKAYEDVTSQVALLPGIPVIARLDGKAFHTYTKGLKRPFDENLSKCMLETTKYLCEKFHPTIAYTQSDEITLVWYNSTECAQFMFKGRYQKLVSILAATASSKFTLLAHELLPEKQGIPVIFDCRLWQVPNIKEAFENIIWRQDDAIKNSITMAARAVYSHKRLHKKNSREKLEMLEAAGVDYYSYPEHFKSGAVVKRITRFTPLTQAELDLIPEKFRQPDTLVSRSHYEQVFIEPYAEKGSLRKLPVSISDMLMIQPTIIPLDLDTTDFMDNYEKTDISINT